MSILTPLKAIRAKCVDCMCGQIREIKLCPIDDCSLYPYRFGKNPNIRREYTEEQRDALRARLAKITPEIKEDSGVKTFPEGISSDIAHEQIAEEVVQ